MHDAFFLPAPQRRSVRRVVPSLAPLLLILWVMTQHPAAAVDLCPKRPLGVAMYESGYLSWQGKGIDHDLLDELGRLSGCRFERMVMPRARALLWLKSGEVGIVMSTRETPERAHYAWFIPCLRQKWRALLRVDPSPAQSTHDGFLPALESDTDQKSRLRWRGEGSGLR
ncbi:hypothetical protein [Rugamonas sp.]|uniref:hypothetical protein n=1 Tax=Rugamonas sp. TaxID=1926287 RepID=UPI0025DE874C|nr:hypothetical protein [Rugamonas sp.]